MSIEPTKKREFVGIRTVEGFAKLISNQLERPLRTLFDFETVENF